MATASAMPKTARISGFLRNFGISIAGLLLGKDYLASVLSERGNLLRDLGRCQDAMASYDRALSFKPDYSEALHNRGLALLELKRPEDAMQSYARLLELAPDYHFVKGKLLHAKMSCCDWGQLIPLTASIEKDIRAGKQSA